MALELLSWKPRVTFATLVKNTAVQLVIIAAPKSLLSLADPQCDWSDRPMPGTVRGYRRRHGSQHPKPRSRLAGDRDTKTEALFAMLGRTRNSNILLLITVSNKLVYKINFKTLAIITLKNLMRPVTVRLE